MLPGVLRTFAEALVPWGQALIGTHVGDGDIARTESYGGLPVLLGRRTSTAPRDVAGMLVAAGLEVCRRAAACPRIRRRCGRRCCWRRGAPG
jgi:hypothetical protein